MEKSSYKTIEALMDQLAQHLLGATLFASTSVSQQNTPEPAISITLRKPAALPYGTPGISIRRQRSDYQTQPTPSASSAATSGSQKKVYIALGSNIGDRVGHIRRAVAELDETNGIRLSRTSKLYESEPMYVEDQDRFINGAVEVRIISCPYRSTPILTIRLRLLYPLLKFSER